MAFPRIIACDPGKVNFAYVLFEGLVKESGWVEPIANPQQDLAFCNQIIELLVRTKPDYISAERFTVRNRGQSVHAENINQMLGRLAILTRLYAGTDLIQITASTWKTWHKRQGNDWHQTYSDLPSVHIRDAAGIAAYTAEHLPA